MIVFLFSQRTVSQRSNFEIERFDQSYFEIPFERIKWIIWNWAFFFWTTVFSGQIFKLFRIWKTFLRKRKRKNLDFHFFVKKIFTNLSFFTVRSFQNNFICLRIFYWFPWQRDFGNRKNNILLLNLWRIGFSWKDMEYKVNSGMPNGKSNAITKLLQSLS